MAANHAHSEPEGSAPVFFLTASTALAAVGAVAVGAAQWLASPATSDLIVPVAVAGVAALSLSAGPAWGERHSRRALNWVLAASLVITGAALWLSRGAAYVMMMPALSCAVLYLSVRWAFAVALLATFEFALVSLNRGAGPLQCSAETLGFASAVLFVCVFSLFAKRERIARREVERLSAQVEELAVANERNRIARELHDTLGHVLTVANVQLEAVRASAEGREERLLRVQALLKSGLADVRRTVTFWRGPPMPEARFPAALLELVEHTEATGLRVAVETRGTPRSLAPGVGFTLYRGAQEALTNVHRHARAANVTLNLEYTLDAVSLRIADDGVGRADLALGNGLRGLQERLGALGGSVSVEAVQPRGLSLTLRVPA